ncbi:zinc finger protein 488 [Dasypus novemcinctus]|uniref:zinc finger protein 488 n=1 Tax=Dasypus novemcinctus TaxID=9361 RepID=UPI00062AC6ED|nr:zinc finger protein 488 [Dasypus novemcinctus]
MSAEQGATPSPAAGDSGQLTWPEPGWGCKPVLLEKTNCPDSETAAGSGGWDAVARVEPAPSAALGKLRLAKALPHRACWGQRQSAFTEVQRLKERLGGLESLEHEHADPGPPRDPAGIVVFSGWPSSARSGPRSAFNNPAKCPAETRGPAVFPASEPRHSLGHLSLTKAGGIPCWSRLSNSEHWVGGFWHMQMWPRNAPLSSAFWGDSTLWLEHAAAETPTPASPVPASSLTLLPPTLTSPGLYPQNWCAVCNLCFRRTTDLVSHMRSCHKKEPVGLEPRAEGRKETIACPVCREHFRERHHLSRHLMSHS